MKQQQGRRKNHQKNPLTMRVTMGLCMSIITEVNSTRNFVTESLPIKSPIEEYSEKIINQIQRLKVVP